MSGRVVWGSPLTWPALPAELQRDGVSWGRAEANSPRGCKCCAPECTCLARCTRPCNENLLRSALHTTDTCRYPPVIDPKMEEAAEALQAIMQDLAAQKPQPDGPALASAEQLPATDPAGQEGDEGAAQEAMDTNGEPGLGLGREGLGGLEGLPQAALASCAPETGVA